MRDPTFAVLGLFDSAQALVDAIPPVKSAGLGALEAYTPYPIHGIDPKLGFRRSPLGGMVFVMGVLGAVTALFFEWWMSAIDYPTLIGGKALFSWQAFVPVMFEVTVLFATFTAGLGMLMLLNKLPLFGHPMLAARSMTGITRDRFALGIEGDGERLLDVDACTAVLTAAGAVEVEVVPALVNPGWTATFATRSIFGIVVACLVSGVGMYWGIKLFHVLPPMVHMQEQPKLMPFEPSTFFADGRGMQPPAPGSVARGHLPYTFKALEDALSLPNPLPATDKVLARGKKEYGEHCTVCHGALGDGVTTLTAAYGAKPANFHTQTLREYTDGKLYHTIVVGKNAMPSYAVDLTEEERWSVVHYIRALQRAQNARPEDVP